MNYYRISEFVYFFISVISFYEMIVLWDLNNEKAYIFAGFGLISSGMGFFRRHFRKKFENRNKK